MNKEKEEIKNKIIEVFKKANEKNIHNLYNLHEEVIILTKPECEYIAHLINELVNK